VISHILGKICARISHDWSWCVWLMAKACVHASLHARAADDETKGCMPFNRKHASDELETQDQSWLSENLLQS
jgi:hypothetical protein